jgi:hypothetical protein
MKFLGLLGSANPTKGRNRMKMFQLSVRGLLFALLSAVPAVAQSVYGGYSFVSVDTNGLTSRQSANGWEAGANFPVRSWFDIEGSFGGYYKSFPGMDLSIVSLSPIHVHDISYGVGPRFNYRGIRSTTLFARVLIGGDTLTGSGSVSADGVTASGSLSQTSFATILGGGFEYNLDHSRWGIRATGDYALTNHNIVGGVQSYTQHNFRTSAGVVYWIGGARERGPVTPPQNKKKDETMHCAGAEDAPMLGITGCSLTDGFLVAAIHAGAANNIGIQKGDIITQINERPVMSAKDIEVAMSLAAGAKSAVKITYLIRGAWQREIQLN